ncbi:hypothetical protein AVEN_32664-1 [Araneus ventricosus]|uniref:Uncharacterized protein n=1 Tax=Araneus ventricosus TaxID=182803 RepID=A0A4Y2CAG5_ARAVE|nr:hypothetical protein AVEN_32664-1 [Araneus ventricosus]
MSLTGPRSWGVAVICSVLNFLHLGTARLSGSLYLAVLERYHVDRSKASLPFILCYTMRNISGPLVGYLATKFGIYTVTMLGGLISFVGIGCCYFAEDITMVILFWGITFGFGFGMGSVLIPEILNHHFDKYVSNANGIAFGGECVAGFVLPIFLKFSLSAYGTSGTFLILSSLMLNSIPATLMLKYLSQSQSPKVHHRAETQKHSMDGNRLNCSINGINSDSFEIKDDKSFETTKLLKGRETRPKYLETKEEFIPIEDPSIRNRNEARRDIFNAKNLNINRRVVYPEDSEKYVPPKLKQANRATNWQEKEKNTAIYQQTDIETPNNQDPKASVSEHYISHSFPEQKRKCKHAVLLETNNSNHSKVENQYTPMKYYGSLDQGVQKFGNLSEEKNSPSDLLIASYEKSPDSHFNNDIAVNFPSVPTLLAPSFLADEQTSPSSPFKIFLDPAFCMILLTQSTMLYNATMFWTIIVDFSRDTGLSSKEEIYILICLSVLDMIGRLGLGWITDARYMSNSAFSGMCCFGMGIAVGTLVFFRKFATIGCSVSIFGLFLGGFLIVCPGVVNDHIHPDNRGMALASRFFLFAPMSLSQSPLIGYFRGKLGSYNFIFIIVAVLCMFSSVTSLLTPYAEKCKSRRTNNGILGRNFDAVASTAGSVGQLQQDGFTKMEQPLALVGKINRALLEA